ncbi:hypothetical protein VPH35_111858 [Triticum aestivum]
MMTTFCRSRVRLLPLVAVLAVAASLEPLTPLSKAMAIDVSAGGGGASVLDKAALSSLNKKLKDVKEGIEHGIEVHRFWDDNKDEIKKQLQPLTPGAQGSSPSGYVVDTGNLKSLVYGIDINSPVTRTGPCEVGARAVSCSAPACRQLYGGEPWPNCTLGPGGPPCRYPYADHHFLYQGKATLFTRPTAMPVPLSLPLYACSPGGGPSAAGAVLSLGRSGTLARTVGAFSYELSDGQGDAIWLGAQRARRVQGGKPTPLISNPLFPNRYYVQIASILVGNQPLQIPRGALDIQQYGRGGVYLSTTMPVGMYLNGEVYDLLKAALQAPGATANGLCYSADAKVPLPTITLEFAGDAVMALRPGSSVWKTRADGARCLSVLPSSTGETIVGTRAQMGRLMTYELATGNAFGFGTVTF